MTPLDAWMIRRTLALAAVLFVVGVAVDRLARIGAASAAEAIGVAPLGPVVAAIAVAWTITDARKNGAIGALEAIGVAPLRARSGAIAAGLVAGLVASSAVARPSFDASVIFPPAPRSTAWRVAEGDPNLRFFAPTEGVALDARGRLAAIDRVAVADVAAAARSPAILRGVGAGSLAIATLGLCLLAALDRRSARVRGSIAIAFGVGQALVFVGVGAGRLALATACAPPLALVAVTLALARVPARARAA